MYVIISASDIETSLAPLSEPISKTLVPINKKPVLQYILDELYSYQSYIDEIVIVKKDIDDIKDYLKYNKQDDFFLTKIHCVEGNDYKHTNNSKYTILDDFYYGMEHLVDVIKVCPSEILLWSGDELIFDSRRLSDMTTGSFICSYKQSPVKVYRFDMFPHVVNTLITLKNDLNLHSIEDFIQMYSQHDKVSIMEDFGEYKKWQDKNSYYKLQAELLQKDEHESVYIDIDTKKQQITKTNKYMTADYSYRINELSREVQYNLWSEASFLEHANEEQRIYLPEFIERGVNKRGEYCDFVIEEFIQGTSLESLLLNESLFKDSWNNLIEKIKYVLSETFHIDELEDDEELYRSYVPSKIRDKFFTDFQNSVSDALIELQEYFSVNNISQNYYVLGNNDIVEWKMFFDRFFEEYKEYLTKDNIIYNYSCERMIHNNLTFDNIIYDTYNDKLSFLNPRTRMWDIVDKNRDYAFLYASVMGLCAILNERFTKTNDEVNISSFIRKRMDDCLDSMDNIFENHIFLKKYALVLMFLECYYKKNSDLLQFCNQLRRTLYFKSLIA